jgi:hypothetical protein
MKNSFFFYKDDDGQCVIKASLQDHFTMIGDGAGCVTTPSAWHKTTVVDSGARQ